MIDDERDPASRPPAGGRAEEEIRRLLRRLLRLVAAEVAKSLARQQAAPRDAFGGAARPGAGDARRTDLVSRTGDRPTE
jgi:hypothetical protein